MPTYFARASGNVNGSIWATTPTGTAAAVTFAAGDVLVANSFTVTLNVNTTVKEIRNDTTGGATAGGSFTLSPGTTLTGDVYAGGVTCLNHSSGSATVVGNITGGTAGNAAGMSVTAAGTTTITGAITGGSIGTAYGINQNGGGNVLAITGNVTGGSAAGVIVQVGASVSIAGNVTGGIVEGLRHTGVQGVTITGNVTGSGSAGVLMISSGTTTVVGTATGAVASGITNSAFGVVVVLRARGGPLVGSAAGVAGAAGAGYTSVEEIEYGDLGASPVSGPIRLSDKSSNVAVMYRFGTTKKTLTDPNATGLMPSAANVRFGTVYNGGNSTGTMRVPAAGSVALGVPVDNTTGTAALTPAAVWDYLTSAATTSGSMGERLKDAATVASTGQQLANALTP